MTDLLDPVTAPGLNLMSSASPSFSLMKPTVLPDNTSATYSVSIFDASAVLKAGSTLSSTGPEGSNPSFLAQGTNLDTLHHGGNADLDRTLVRPSFLRRLSPGLAARVKLLDSSNKSEKDKSVRHASPTVGRIPEQQLKELDSLHQNLSIKVEKRGRAWSGTFASKRESDYRRDRDSSLPESRWLRGSNRALQPSDRDRQDTVASSEMMSVAASGGGSSSRAKEAETSSDYEKYVLLTAEASAGLPPPPPPKNSPPVTASEPLTATTAAATSMAAAQSYFNPRGLHRTESIYSFSRASFSNQLSQLTSISLPQPSSLEASIAGISNAPAAIRALIGAAEQIQIWIRRAFHVLSGLDAEDDVEWAAAGGREGLDDVDKAITRFESLVNVYVKAIEDVQLRPDIGNVGPEALTGIVVEMESILQNWAEIKGKLRGVKEQVELAMEWEELWTNVLGDVGQEVNSLSGLIFEMEEKRHRAMTNVETADTGSGGGVGSVGLDINELETIVEESPSHAALQSNKRFSIGPDFVSSSAGLTMPTPSIQTPQDDSNYSSLMALFARMQPLRASLDFLPMRLSMFQSRAQQIFPSACEELEERRAELEQNYKTLEDDAEALRKELSEDRWILVFRNAGSQAQRMFESVERSIAKLQELFESGALLPNSTSSNTSGLVKRIENYEAKKQHYIPAIERVISIIRKGVKDRLTVNGEILTLLSDMQSRMDALKASITVMDGSLDEIGHLKTQQLRDSISTIVTMDSPLTGSAVDTPGSSPASSVVITPGVGGGPGSSVIAKGSSTPVGSSGKRDSSVGSATSRAPMAASTSKTRRFSGIPQTAGSLSARKPSIPKPLLSPSPSARKAASRIPPPPSSQSNRPRWNGSTNTNDLEVGHTYKPLPSASSAASANRKMSVSSRLSRPSSTLPLPSPFISREHSVSPVPGNGMGSSARSSSRVSSRLASRSPVAFHTSPSPTSPLPPSLRQQQQQQQQQQQRVSSSDRSPYYNNLRRPSAPVAGMQNLLPRTRQSFAGVSPSARPPVSAANAEQGGSAAVGPETPSKPPRPGTSLGHSSSSNRRASLLPLPKTRVGRESSDSSKGQADGRPPWR